MKINPADIDNFINNNLHKMIAILVYGPDDGLIKERVKEISAKIIDDVKDPFQRLEFSYDKVKDDFSSVIDAIFSISLSRKKRLITLGNCGNNLPSSIGEILTNYKGNNFILFTASDLSPSSALRKFF